MSDIKDRVKQVILAEADVGKGFIPDHAKNKFSDNSGNLKCPFCQQELKYDSWNEVYMCRNPNCKHLLGFGTKELWQELIRTRKALDVAKDKLDTVRQYHRGTAVIRPDDIAAYCDRALEQITALEQKD